MFNNCLKTYTASEKAVWLPAGASGVLAQKGTSYRRGNLTPLLQRTHGGALVAGRYLQPGM